MAILPLPRSPQLPLPPRSPTAILDFAGAIHRSIHSNFSITNAKINEIIGVLEDSTSGLIALALRVTTLEGEMDAAQLAIAGFPVFTPFWKTRVETDTTAALARTGLGATTVGSALFTAGTAGAARGTLGSTTVGDAVFVAANAAAGRTALVAQEDLGWKPVAVVDLIADVTAVVVAIPAGITSLRFSGRVRTSVPTAATYLRLGTGPSTFIATANYIKSAFFSVGTTASGQGNTAETIWIFAYENGDGAFTTPVDAQLDFGHGGVWYPRFISRSAAYTSVPSGANVLAFYHGWYQGGLTPTHLQWHASTGNMAAGTKIIIEGR